MSSDNQLLAKYFYQTCWLITPYSSKYFSKQEAIGLNEFEEYSLQAASLAARLTNLYQGEYELKGIYG